MNEFNGSVPIAPDDNDSAEYLDTVRARYGSGSDPSTVLKSQIIP